MVSLQLKELEMAGPGGKELKGSPSKAQGCSGSTGSLAKVRSVAKSAKPKAFKGKPSK